MIKKKLFKFTSCLMCAAMIACSFTACGTKANVVASAVVSQNNETQDAVSQAFASFGAGTTSNVKTASSATTNTKDETVYVFTDVSGKQDHVVVNEKLKNVTKLSSISDVSSLKDIKNVSGDETFTTGSNNGLTWAANGGSLTYQGTTDKEAPVTIKVTYKLDGKEISGSDLAGKSGKVTIRYDYTNNSKQTVVVNGQTKTLCVPFAVITGLALDTEKFSNITVTNGKLVESDKSNIAVGFAMPGVKSALNSLSLADKNLDIDVPEYFEVSADVKDFELEMAMTMASSNLFSDVNVDDINLNSFKDQANELQDATNQLMDGSSQLADGTTTLVDGANQLADGTGQLADKVPALTSGISQLDNGAGQLKDGTQQLFEKMPTLAGGIGQIADGANLLVAGVNSLNDKVNNELKPGTESLVNGVQQITDGVTKTDEENPGLEKGISDYTNGVDSAAQGSSQVAAGLDSLKAQLDENVAPGVAQLDEGAKQLKAAINDSFNEIANNAKTYSDKLTQTVSQAKQVENAGTSINTALSEYGLSLEALGATNLTPYTDLTTKDITSEATVKELTEKYLKGYSAIVTAKADAQKGALIAGIESKIGQSLETLYANEVMLLVSATGNGGVATALGTISQKAADAGLSDKLDQLVGGTGLLAAGVGSATDSYANGNKTIYGAVNDLKAGSGQLNAGLQLLSSNSKALNSGVQTLKGGLAQLYAGAVQIRDGVAVMTSDEGIPKLLDGALQLQAGLGQLTAQLPALTDGITQLTDGAKALKDGTSTLASNADPLANGISQLNEGAQALKDGALQLNEGAFTLKDGLIQFNDEAISKITSLVGADADTAIDTIKKLVELGNNYQSFAGKSDSVEGTVKFIYKTASISKN